MKVLKIRGSWTSGCSDLEWSEQRKLGSARRWEKIALAFLNKIPVARYKVGIYCNVDWYQNVLTAALKKYNY